LNPWLARPVFLIVSVTSGNAEKDIHGNTYSIQINKFIHVVKGDGPGYFTHESRISL
jgi:hypothetical protein